MEFKIRAGDNGASRPSTYIATSSTNTFHTEHALSEVIKREREKSRIREEILTAEILRRRELEAEVRRELMIERALMRGEGLSLFESSMPPLLQSDLRGFPLHYQNGAGIEERLSMMGHSEVGSFRGLPIQQHRPVIKLLPQVKNSSPLQVSGVQALLAKSLSSNAARVKRKAETLAVADANEMPSISTSKNLQKEWKCALCQVSTTCERGLNDHLQGKKHKAKEASLKASKTANPASSNSYRFPKRSEMSSKQAVSTGSLNPKQGESPRGNEKIMKNGNDIAQKVQNTEDLMINGVLLSDKKKQHLKFWCQMCNCGTNSEAAMETHKNGKKHMTLLQKNGGAVIAISTVPEDVRTVETIVTKGGKEDSLENAGETKETEAQGGEDSLGNAEETNETEETDSVDNAEDTGETEAQGREDSLGNAEETKDTAAKEGKEDSLG